MMEWKAYDTMDFTALSKSHSDAVFAAKRRKSCFGFGSDDLKGRRRWSGSCILSRTKTRRG
jgi:hypothetical protein